MNTPMSIAFGLIYDEGIIFASDSTMHLPGEMSVLDEHKIQGVCFKNDPEFMPDGPDDIPGSALIVKSGARDTATEFVTRFAAKASLTDLDNAGALATEVLRDTSTYLGSDMKDAAFLLGYYDSDYAPRIQVAYEMTRAFTPAPAHFAAVGTSFELGNYLLNVLAAKNMSFQEAQTLAVYIVAHCIRHGQNCDDPIFVSIVTRDGCMKLSDSDVSTLRDSANAALPKVRQKVLGVLGVSYASQFFEVIPDTQ